MFDGKEVLPGIVIHPRIVELKRGKVEYDLTEGDGPVVLSLHGGLGGVDQARVIAGFVKTDEFRVLAVSRPGFCGTPLQTAPTLETQADMFAELLDALGIEKVSVVSASAGGPPGYVFAIRHPDRVRSLIAIDSVSGYYDMPESAGPLTQIVFLSDTGQKLIKWFSEKNIKTYIKQMFAAEGYFTKQQMEAHIDYVVRNPERLAYVRGFMETTMPYSIRKEGTENDMKLYRTLTHLEVEKIQCPCYIFHGTHDADVKLYDGVYVYEYAPNTKRMWIEEGSHFAFWLSKHAEEAQNAAMAFLRETAQ